MCKVWAHIIHEDRGLITKVTSTHVPRIGDELRVEGDRYYKVTLIVWVFDEPDCPYQRVNIGVVDVTDARVKS